MAAKAKPAAKPAKTPTKAAAKAAAPKFGSPAWNTKYGITPKHK